MKASAGKPISWYRSARKHRIGRTSALHVMASSTAHSIPAAGGLDARLRWEGPDDRGRVLEIVALDLPEMIVLIHVFPVSLRRETK